MRAALLVAVLALSGCAKAPLIVRTIADVSQCIDENINESPEVIAVICGMKNTPDFVALLAQRKKAYRMAYEDGVTHTVEVAHAFGVCNDP